MKFKKSQKHKLFRRGLASVALLAAPLVAPQAAYAVGEQTGRIAGVITDKLSGAPLPGARVEVRGQNLIGGPRSILTADDGSYEFISMPPGPYDVTLTFEGAKPLHRKIIVRQGETFPLNIAWTVEETKEELKVIYEERKMTRPDNTQTGTVLTSDQQARIATGRSYQNVAQQVAGVSGGGNPNIKGGMLTHNRYLVDGLDITDPVTNTFSANMNFDSIESIEVLTGGTEAQYNSLGGIINLITSAGSNEWHIDSSLYINHQSLSAGGQYGPQLYYGQRPFARLAASPNSGYQANVNVGGPIIKNKWWFNLSFQYDRRESAVVIGPPLYVQHPSRVFTGYLFRFKTAIAPTERHRITLSVSTDPAFIDNVDATNSELGVAENHQNQGGAFGILQWDWFISDKVNTNVQTGFQYSSIDFGPQGYFGAIDNSGYIGNPAFSDRNKAWNPAAQIHNNLDDDTYWYQGAPYQFDRRYTFQFDPSVSVRGSLLGKHEAKFGLQARYIRHTLSFDVPGGRSYYDGGGGTGEMGLCLPEIGQTAGCNQIVDQQPYEQFQDGSSVGLFAQDRWKVTSWLRINPGLRFDYGRTTNSQGEVVSNFWGFGPRLGLVVDLTQDQKTIFTAYYGRSNEVLSLLAASSADVTSLACTYQWNPDVNNPQFPATQGDRRYECPQVSDRYMGRQPWKPAYTSGGKGGYTLEPDRSPPHTDEITLSVRREAFQNSMVGVDYTYKRVGDIWDGQEVNQIWDPTGIRVVDYVNGQPQQIFKYTTFSDNWRVYQGVDFLFEARPRQEWDFAVIYTLSWLYGPGAEQLGQISGDAKRSQFYNPRMYGFFDGYLGEDRRHQLKIRASYTFKGFTFGAFFNYQTGTPVTKRYYNQNDGGFTVRRSPTGTAPYEPNDIAAIAELRLPALLTVDARISYDVASLFTQKVHLTVFADMFNMFNLDVATGIRLTDTATFGQIATRQTPLRFQLGARFQY